MSIVISKCMYSVYNKLGRIRIKTQADTVRFSRVTHDFNDNLLGIVLTTITARQFFISI